MQSFEPFFEPAKKRGEGGKREGKQQGQLRKKERGEGGREREAAMRFPQQTKNRERKKAEKGRERE